MIITSFSNQHIKYIRKLDQKKYRQQTGEFFVEGLRTVGEAVQTGAPIQSLVIAPDLLVSDFGKSLLSHPALAGVRRIEVSPAVYRRMAHKDGPQGLGAIVQQRWTALKSLHINPEDVWIALDAVSDPGNLGTILRTADAVGCRGLILLGNSTDPHDPTAVKASMGALFSLELVQSDWPSFARWLPDQGIGLVGTSDSAQTDYQAVRYEPPLILLMGSERHGLEPAMEKVCDHLVAIPMTGRSDSLNLAVATAVMLYEIFNQNRKKG